MKALLVTASTLGALAVILGAFGAHALKDKLPPEMLQAFETGVRYQMYHVLAIFAAASIGARRAGWTFIAGIMLFSGSLYGLSLMNWTWLGPVTPLGGLAFIAGWIALAVAAARR